MGCNLSRPMTVAFAVDVPSAEAGRAVAVVAAAAGYRVALERDDEDGEWTCYCSRDMIAEYAALLESQEELSRLSMPHDGRCESWGTAGNAL